MSQPYADHVADYYRAGWPCVLPVPPETKSPPPSGFTGAEGRDTDPLVIVDLATRFPGHAIALRMPAWSEFCVIGIDVDQYRKGEVEKRGAETLAAYLERWGPLPATWTSTARDPKGPSRIYFFRAPAQRYATRLAVEGPGGTGDVEIIQRHHRYAVVWPSTHKDAGTYTWYDPSGVAVDAPPKPGELPELPAAWVAGLAEGAASASLASADAGSGQALLEQLLDDWRPECADVTSARLTALDAMQRSTAGTRHDVMTERTHHLIQLAAAGHTGVAAALAAVRELWEAITAGEERADELDRALLTSARKAVTAVGPVQVPRDPCLFMAGGTPLPPNLPSPAAADPGDDADPGKGEDSLQIEPPETGLTRWGSVRQLIGAHAFDPIADLDQSLAEAVLERIYPVLRYAHDADGWLLRAPTRWELYKRLSPWAIAQVTTLMPVGDPTADKESEAFHRSKRRSRLMTAAGAAGVAKMMDSLVAAGTHPASVKLGDLDADPEVLWAAGMPYSLRLSADGPTLADVDPATPHLHSTRITPELRPTPLWDAFLAAVWPDPEIRAWALRVLSIAATGYADRALPILLGETGRGKTQVVHLLMSVLGSYAHAADSRLISPAGDRTHASIVFALKGRRLSFIDEAPRDSRDAQERLKQLTGGGELTANAMNQNPITFSPTHTLVLTANLESEPTLTDPAVRSRARLIPCDGDPEEVWRARAAIGKTHSAAWRAEAPGVLARLMAEAGAWLADPTTAHTAAAPESIRYLAERLGAEQDPVMAWLEEECEPFDEGTPSRELYQAFTASCRRNNMRRDLVPTETKWGRTLTRLGYPSVNTHQGKRRQLRLRNGGFLPGSGPSPAQFMGAEPVTDAETSGGGLVQNGGGLVAGSNPNPHGTKPQVNPSVSVEPWRVGGLVDTPTHIHAPAQARETPIADSPEPATRSVGEQAVIPGLTCENADSEAQSEPATQTRHRAEPRAKRPQDPDKAAAARQKRAVQAEEKRQAAIAAAAGPSVQLPALVAPGSAVTPLDLGQVDQLLATVTSTDQALTVDVEHTGYPAGHRDYALRTVQLGNEHFAVVLDATDPAHGDVARRHLEQASTLHAHVAVADLAPLARAGLLDLESAWARMLDTSIPAKLADPTSETDLKGLAKSVLGDAAQSPAADKARSELFKAGRWMTDIEPDTALERSGWAQVDHGTETMIRYDGSDVLDTAALAHRVPWPPADVLARERLTLRMVARVAEQGLRIDGDRVQELLAQQRADLEAAGDQLRAFGIESPGSDQQVAAAAERLGIPLPRTKTGKPSVAKGAIEKYSRTEGPIGDLVRARLAYQIPKNRIGLFLNHYEQAVVNGDGRVYPTVYTLGARTGRMSCVRPNVQQVPRAGGFRACLTADPGELLISADFAGVELRVAAALSGDQHLMRILDEADRNPEAKNDLHWQVARIAFGPDATKADRYAVKRGVFGRIYGGGVEAVANGVGVLEPVARQVIDAMDLLTPGLTEWSRMVREGVQSGRTQFVTYSGRVIQMPTDRPHAAPNYCIQGTARELLIDALTKWSRTRWGDRPLFPVHDELVVRVPEDEAEEALATLTELMAADLRGVPIIAEASVPAFAWQDSE